MPAISRKRLPEVASPIEESDTDDGNAQITGSLEVIARENSEATGVLRQGLGDTEFRREVRDGTGRLRTEMLKPSVCSQVRVQIGSGVPDARHELRIGRQFIPPGSRHLTEHRGRVVLHVCPQRRVNAREELTCARMPGPAQVHGEIGKRRQRLRQNGADGESSDRSHGPRP